MALRLDPRVPTVWRTPTSLQLGVDRPICVLDPTTRSTELMLAALAVGVSRSALELVASETRAGPNAVAELLAAVEPALCVGSASDRAGARLAIDGPGPTGRLVGALLQAARPGIEIRQDAPPRGVDLAVVVAHYVVEPARYARWLRRDVPHLPIVFGDREVRIGPLVEPGDGPCLHCLDLHRADRDASWPAIATQLLGRTAATETARGAHEAAAIAARWLTARLDGDTSHSSGSIAIDEATGGTTPALHREHARCGCRSLPENGTAPVGLRAVDRARPS
jgi:bacteriocin biosynthesis cyclodehydratase domain-containing protein